MNHPHSDRPDLAAPPGDTTLRSAQFQLPRRRGPGLLAAGVIGGVIAFAAVSSWYGSRSDAVPTAPVAGASSEPAPTATAPAAPADADITAAVKAALAQDPALDALPIEVETHEGVVTLKGPAPDEAARDRAGLLAAASVGVRDVDNQLRVGAAVSG